MISPGVGIVGCGMIAQLYADQLAGYEDLRLVAAADVDGDRALALAELCGCRAYGSLDELLADDAVEIVVNLTVPRAHAEVTRRALESGRHVYSEKPLALETAEARSLVALAEARGLRLGCSPCTLLGEAQQTAWRLVRDGTLGDVRAVYAEANGGRLETWHPAPEPFYDVGALFDIGVYPLTLVTGMLGPARRVAAVAGLLRPERVTASGRGFTIETPDFAVVTVELACGALVRLTANFYVPRRGTKQSGIELHGDAGSLHLSDWQRFDAAVERGAFGREMRYEQVPLLADPFPGTEWARGILDLVRAIAEGRPHRATGEHAAHVVEIVCAAARAAASGGRVEIASTFTPSAPMEWAA